MVRRIECAPTSAGNPPRPHSVHTPAARAALLARPSPAASGALVRRPRHPARSEAAGARRRAPQRPCPRSRKLRKFAPLQRPHAPASRLGPITPQRLPAKTPRGGRASRCRYGEDPRTRRTPRTPRRRPDRQLRRALEAGEARGHRGAAAGVRGGTRSHAAPRSKSLMARGRGREPSRRVRRARGDRLRAVEGIGRPRASRSASRGARPTRTSRTGSTTPTVDASSPRGIAHRRSSTGHRSRRDTEKKPREGAERGDKAAANSARGFEAEALAQAQLDDTLDARRPRARRPGARSSMSAIEEQPVGTARVHLERLLRRPRAVPPLPRAPRQRRATAEASRLAPPPAAADAPEQRRRPRRRRPRRPWRLVAGPTRSGAA